MRTNSEQMFSSVVSNVCTACNGSEVISTIISQKKYVKCGLKNALCIHTCMIVSLMFFLLQPPGADLPLLLTPRQKIDHLQWTHWLNQQWYWSIYYSLWNPCFRSVKLSTHSTSAAAGPQTDIGDIEIYYLTIKRKKKQKKKRNGSSSSGGPSLVSTLNYSRQNTRTFVVAMW